MGQGNIYKPRNKISFITKSKIWPDKNGFFRHFFSLRGRRLFRKQDLFIRCVLVATSIKWLAVRRSRRPARVSSGIRRIKSASDNKTAFGRPLKQRYRDRFYAKQQLRLFHGEIKETVFRNLFKTHLKSVAVRTKSFFAGLESRLDIILFRIRLLPTIFACRQFINHQGLEVNSVIQKSPRSLVSTGDRVSLPSKVWKGFYFNIFQRIYYRRWGLYIRRRRLFKQIKKLSYFVRRRFRWRWSRKKIIRGQVQLFSVKRQSLSRRVLAVKKAITNKATVIRLFKMLNVSKKGVGRRSTKWRSPNSHQKKGLDDDGDFFMIKEAVKKTVSQIGAPNRLRLFSNKNPRFNILFSMIVANSGSNNSKDVGQSRAQYKSRLNSFTNISSRMFSQISEAQVDSKKQNILLTKRVHYQKIAFSNRFRKISLPQSFKYVSEKRNKIAHHFFKRTKLRRFYFKKYKKSVQSKKRIRLKGVHFFIPSYLQIDFRTLRVIKVQSPSEEEIFYPFRISLPKRYSFYRSKGF